MKIQLINYKIIESYDYHDYISYRYRINDSTCILEIQVNVKNTDDPIKYFIKDMNDLYKIDNYDVLYKNMKYKYNKGGIYEFKIY